MISYLWLLMSDNLSFTSFKVADRLSKEPKISAVYSSDLKRALETAQIIASSCGELEVLIQKFPLVEFLLIGKSIISIDFEKCGFGQCLFCYSQPCTKLKMEAT